MLDSYRQYIGRLKAKGVELTQYKCPSCVADIETLTPPDEQTWDSYITCPYCGSIYFLVITRECQDTTLLHTQNTKPQLPVAFIDFKEASCIRWTDKVIFENFKSGVPLFINVYDASSGSFAESEPHNSEKQWEKHAQKNKINGLGEGGIRLPNPQFVFVS